MKTLLQLKNSFGRFQPKKVGISKQIITEFWIYSKYVMLEYTYEF